MSSAELGGDVGGTDQVPMPLEPAVRTGEPAPAWLGDALAAGRAGRGRPPLLDHAHPDPGLLGLVAERSEQVGAAPLPQPPVLHPARVPVGDAGRVTHHQGPHPVGHREGDDLAGGLVVDPAAVAGLGPPLGPHPPISSKQELLSRSQAHTSPAARGSRWQRLAWAPVVRRQMRAVRCTSSGLDERAAISN
jgi:hypothetical protein